MFLYTINLLDVLELCLMRTAIRRDEAILFFFNAMLKFSWHILCIKGEAIGAIKSVHKKLLAVNLAMLLEIFLAVGYVAAAIIAAFFAVVIYYGIRTIIQGYRLRDIPEPPVANFLMGHFDKVSQSTIDYFINFKNYKRNGQLCRTSWNTSTCVGSTA